MGVTQGSRLVYESRLSSARSLTNSSPVASIKDLVFWIETTSEKSFDDTDLNSDSLEINTWHDINPTARYAHGLESSSPGIPVPTYEKDGIAGLPSVFFNAATNGLAGNSLKNIGNEPTQGSNEFSIFIVAQAKEATTAIGSLLQATSGVTGYWLKKTTSPEWVVWNGNGSTWSEVKKTAIHNHPVILNSYYKGGTHYLSKNSGTPATITAAYSPLSTNLLYIGGWSGAFFDGFISEVIIYNRGLKLSETEAVEIYLSKKYSIVLE